MEELKPCPFCGSKKLVYSNNFINCMDCGALVAGKSNQEEHIKAWNNRVESDELPEWLKEQINIELRLKEQRFNQDSRNSWNMSDIGEHAGYMHALKYVLSLRRGD
jgi:transcription initiation factor TFIIIB Brf1 subunit/transcription initiation factor TFIIB